MTLGSLTNDFWGGEKSRDAFLKLSCHIIFYDFSCLKAIKTDKTNNEMNMRSIPATIVNSWNTVSEHHKLLYFLGMWEGTTTSCDPHIIARANWLVIAAAHLDRVEQFLLLYKSQEKIYNFLASIWLAWNKTYLRVTLQMRAHFRSDTHSIGNVQLWFTLWQFCPLGGAL